MNFDSLENELKAFSYISSNSMSKRIEKLITKNDDDYVGTCDCYSSSNINDDSKSSEGLCFSNGFSCNNFASRQECYFSCNTGNCGNQRIMQLRSSLDLSTFLVKLVEGRGYGFHISGRSYNKGDIIIKYVGEVTDESTYKKRMKKKPDVDCNIYMMDLGIQGYYIDAERKGNYARFINHSCNPNATLEKWMVSFLFVFCVPFFLLIFS